MNSDAARYWLCERPLGEQIQLHHTVPKVRKGKVSVPVHPICHRTIHAHFTNGELARLAGALQPLLDHPEIARFVAWVKDKPANFHAPTRRPKGK